MGSAVLDRLDAAVQELAALSWDGLGDDEVVEVLRRVETVKRRRRRWIMPWCEINHVPEFQTSHRTTMNEGALTCAGDHRHHQAMGWTATMLHGTPALDPAEVARPGTTSHPTVEPPELVRLWSGIPGATW